MRIAEHHVPGTAKHRLSQVLHPAPEYTPTCAWPEDCTVQWGHGIIPAVPFFEAFPKGTFIRGEGKGIAEAERDAFAQYQRDLACDHHWGRTRYYKDGRTTLYTNGAGFCRKCGGFRSSMFKPIVPLNSHRRPLDWWEENHLLNVEPDPEFDAYYAAKFPAEASRLAEQRRIARIRRRIYGVKSRD